MTEERVFELKEKFGIDFNFVWGIINLGKVRCNSYEDVILKGVQYLKHCNNSQSESSDTAVKTYDFIKNTKEGKELVLYYLNSEE